MQTTTHSPTPCNSQAGRLCSQILTCSEVGARIGLSRLLCLLLCPVTQLLCCRNSQKEPNQALAGGVGRRLLKEINVGTIQILLFACKHSFRVPSLPYSYAPQAPLGHPEFSGPSWWNRKYFLYFLLFSNFCVILFQHVPIMLVLFFECSFKLQLWKISKVHKSRDNTTKLHIAMAHFNNYQYFANFVSSTFHLPCSLFPSGVF